MKRQKILKSNFYNVFFSGCISVFFISCSDLNQNRSFTGVKPLPPVVVSSEISLKENVKWFWNSTNYEPTVGTGIFSYRLNGGNWSSETIQRFFVPDNDLENGTHLLEVREKNPYNKWSDVGSKRLEVTDKIVRIYLYKDNCSSGCTQKSFSFFDDETINVEIVESPPMGILNNVLHDGVDTISFNYTPEENFEGELFSKLSLNDGSDLAKDVILIIKVFDPATPVVPNDYFYGELWGLKEIEANYAWNISTDCRDVLVGVIDTGISSNHVDLQNNIYGGLGYNAVDDNFNPIDDNGHGTHVAGTIAGSGNNSWGVAGVCWTAQVVAIKVLDRNGAGFFSDIDDGINYARINNIHITNNSYGGYLNDTDPEVAELRATIQSIRDAGQIFVAAAGNDTKDIDGSSGVFVPAIFGGEFDNVITVAAMRQNRSIAAFSNYGELSVNISAPGVDIVSTISRKGYASSSGTSMAAPHVAGSVALLWSLEPSLTYTQVIEYISNYSRSAHESFDGKLRWNWAPYSGGQLLVTDPIIEMLKFTGKLDEL